MHSPPRKVTAADHAAWQIPPCVSSWKNAKGYIIPLDKRLAADGRTLQDTGINDGFAGLSEALLVAERKARQEVEMRAAIQKKLALKEKETKEAELRQLAAKARMERAGIAPLPPSAFASSSVAPGDRHAAEDRPFERDADALARNGLGFSAPVPAAGVGAAAETEEEARERHERDALRRDRQREMQREFLRDSAQATAAGAGAQMPPSKKARMVRDEDRDISEKIALGMPVGAASGNAEALFDARLFNQSEGISSGFGDEEEYNVYSKAWRGDAVAASIYRPRAGNGSGVLDDDAADAEVRRLQGGVSSAGGAAGAGSGRFKPTKDFEGVDRSGPRSGGPVQFEKETPALVQAHAGGGSGDDPFGLDQFLSEATKGRNALDSIGKKGFMSAAGGGSMRAPGDRGGSGRDSIQFTSSGLQKQ
jgi:SNW domain-containing protein 1